MVEKKIVYKTSDGNEYKTEASALKHERKLENLALLKQKGWSPKEFQSKLELVSVRNEKIKVLLEVHKKWENFPPMLVKNILDNSDDLLSLKFVTRFVLEKKVWGGIRTDLLAEEKGEVFAPETLHCQKEFPWEELEVKEVRQKNEFTKEVVLCKKYDKHETSLMKLKSNFKLESDEISSLLWGSISIYEEKGENNRWSRENLTVINVDGEFYAIEWSEGLTESQENEFYTQPYKVKVEEREVVVKKTFVTKL